MSCHTRTDSESAHQSASVRVACVDCHGGDAAVSVPAGTVPGSSIYEKAKTRAHVAAAKRGASGRAPANPEITATAWERESAEFVRFVNPGDLRVAAESLRDREVPSARRSRTSRPR